MTAQLDRTRLATLLAAEDARFVERHPRSRALHDEARQHLLDGVPMNWMTRWASPFPPFVEKAWGSRFRCVDGHEYIDFCLGDTGAMTGHSPAAAVAAIAAQAARGITTMLPTEDGLWVAGELTRRFGLRYWQMALTATDANRFALRLARHVTRRPKVLVFNYCYHGSVDEALITLDDGVAGPVQGNVGPAVDPALTTRVVEFNDVAALEQALAPGDVACVLAEPALTNIGIVLPEPGFHDALRRLTRETGTLLIIDETHTLCAGPGGCTGAWGLQPDMLTIGKPIGSGVPSAAYGFGQAIADLIHADWRLPRRRRRRHRRHAGRQRPLAGGDARHPRRGAHRDRLRAHDRARRALHRRRPGRDRRVPAALDRQTPWLPGRVLVRGPCRRATAARRPRPKTRTSTATCTSSRSTVASS